MGIDIVHVLYNSFWRGINYKVRYFILYIYDYNVFDYSIGVKKKQVNPEAEVLDFFDFIIKCLSKLVKYLILVYVTIVF